MTSTNPDIAVRCRGLVKRYADVVAVNGLDLEIRRGECFGLLGPNGAGKTTTIEILEGLTPPDSGEVEILGQSWEKDARKLREKLGISLQETQLADKLTVDEVVRQSNLTTHSVTGGGLVQLALELEKKPGVDSVAPFGMSLHVSGRDRAALEAAIALYRNDPKLVWKEIEASLEDVFIGLMAQAKDNVS